QNSRYGHDNGPTPVMRHHAYHLTDWGALMQAIKELACDESRPQQQKAGVCERCRQSRVNLKAFFPARNDLWVIGDDHVEIIFFSIPTPAAMARWYSRGTVAESCRAIP